MLFVTNVKSQATSVQVSNHSNSLDQSTDNDGALLVLLHIVDCPNSAGPSKTKPGESADTCYKCGGVGHWSNGLFHYKRVIKVDC